MQVRVEERASREFVMSLDGELDMSTEPLLTGAVTELMARGGVATLVVDLSELRFLDSSGMRALLQAQAAAEEQGAKLRLSRPRENVSYVLRVAALDHILGIEDNETGPSRSGSGAG